MLTVSDFPPYYYQRKCQRNLEDLQGTAIMIQSYCVHFETKRHVSCLKENSWFDLRKVVAGAVLIRAVSSSLLGDVAALCCLS